MRFFVQATDAPRPASAISLVLAGVFTVFATAQLFTFEKFPDVTQSWLLAGGYPTAHLLAALIPTLEIFALPFFLSMRLSPLMRALSLACGWLVAAGWLLLSAMLAGEPVLNIGYLGATVPLAAGWTAVVIAALLVIGVGFVSWRFFAERQKRATA